MATALHDVQTIEQAAENLARALRGVLYWYLYHEHPHPLTKTQFDAQCMAAYEAGYALGAYGRLVSQSPE